VPGSLVPGVLLLVAYMLIPGAGTCFATRVALGRSHITFLAMSFGMGFAVVALTSLTLVLLRIFEPGSLAGSWVVVSLVAWTIAVRRGRIGGHVRYWKAHIAADSAAAIGSTLVLIGVAAARWTVPPLSNIASTVLRYWADGLEIADTGGLPRDTLQWSSLLEPVTNKVVLNSFNGGVSFLLGRGPLDPLAILLFVVTLGLVIISMAFFWELGIRRFAPVGALLLFANQVTGSELTAALGRNLAEDWGRLVAFGAVLAAAIALRRGRRAGAPADGGTGAGDPSRRTWHPASIAAGLLLGVAAGTHLVAASFGAACIVGLATASVAVRRDVRRHVVRLGIILGVAAVLGGIILTLPPGDLGLKGALGSAEYRDLLSDLGLPSNFDPTRFIVTHSTEAAESTEPIDTGDVMQSFAYRVAGMNFLDTKPGSELPPMLLVGPTILALILAMAVFVWGPPPLRVSVLAATMIAGLLLVVGIAFAYRYELFALEAFGNRRLFNYAAVPYVLVLTAAGEGVLWLLRSKVRLRRSAVAFLGFTVVAAVGALMIPKATWAQAERRAGLEHQLELLEWLGEHVSCEGRILANRRTLGTFETITGRVGVLEGMGPHVRPAVLGLAIREIFRARDFFLDPLANERYLDERGIAAVLVTRSPNRFGGYGGLPRSKPHGLDDVPFLRRAYENASGTVYVVRGFRPNPSLPQAVGRPGFDCAVIN
jgi:hypothetical protein